MICGVGIGDILIAKMILQSFNFKNKVNIVKSNVKLNRNDSKQYFEFMNKLENILFSEQTEPYLNTPAFNFIHSIKDVSLIKYFKNYDTNTHLDFEYITINPKVRFDGCQFDFLKNETKLVIDFFSKFKSKYPIVILGERKLDGNAHTLDFYYKTNQLPKYRNEPLQYSLYDDLIDILKINNTVIDYTIDDTLLFNPVWDNFIKDIFIINNAVANINMGVGGNVVMACAFSNSNLIYKQNNKHPFFNIKTIQKSFYNNLNNFLNDIKKICEE